MRGALGIVGKLVSSGPRFRAYLEMATRHYDSRSEGECPCCGFRGKFQPEPHLAMAESCPGCGSLERQRLLALSMRSGFVSFGGKDVLHFAPDPAIDRLVAQQTPKTQVSADYTPGRADIVLNIEEIAQPEGSFDRIICSHVLEHVEDRKALPELYRILRRGGTVVIMLPIVEGWEQTYENAEVDGEAARTAHFGQWDHVRYFGADLRARIAGAGFGLSEFTAEGTDVVKYKLCRGEKVFLAQKP